MICKDKNVSQKNCKWNNIFIICYVTDKTFTFFNGGEEKYSWKSNDCMLIIGTHWIAEKGEHVKEEAIIELYWNDRIILLTNGLQDAGSLFAFCIRGSSKEMHFNMTKKRLVIVSNGFLFDQYHIPHTYHERRKRKSVEIMCWQSKIKLKSKFQPLIENNRCYIAELHRAAFRYYDITIWSHDITLFIKWCLFTSRYTSSLCIYYNYRTW